MASPPQDRFYESHGLRLHYADWGNESASPLILIHGGRDHCRSWDVIARSLQPHYHVLAPDLRGHGDSDWTRGGSYALTEYVYDLTRLVRHIGAREVAIAGHSMGGMVGLIYAGTFPDQVSALVVLDGVTVMPNAKMAPAHERITTWAGQLDKLEERAPRRYATIAQAAAQIRAYNKRLPDELALHLATFGVRRNDDGFVRVGAPEGIERFGGIDIDHAIFGHVATTLGDAIGALDRRDPSTRVALAQLAQSDHRARERREPAAPIDARRDDRHGDGREIRQFLSGEGHVNYGLPPTCPR